MSQPINLADPEFEPTDEQLMGLSTRAFAGVAQARADALSNLRAEISRFRAQALEAYEDRLRASAANR